MRVQAILIFSNLCCGVGGGGARAASKTAAQPRMRYHPAKALGRINYGNARAAIPSGQQQREQANLNSVNVTRPIRYTAGATCR